MKKKLQDSKREKREEEKLVVQDDQKFLARLQITNARKIDFKQILSNYYTTKK